MMKTREKRRFFNEWFNFSLKNQYRKRKKKEEGSDHNHDAGARPCAKQQNRFPALFMKTVVLSAALFSVPLHAQTLTNGGVTTDAISAPGEEDTHQFTATAGETVSLTLVDLDQGNFSPQIRLLDPNGAEIRRDSGATVAAIENIVLPRSGDYTVVVLDVSAGSGNTGATALF